MQSIISSNRQILPKKSNQATKLLEKKKGQLRIETNMNDRDINLEMIHYRFQTYFHLKNQIIFIQ